MRAFVQDLLLSSSKASAKAISRSAQLTINALCSLSADVASRCELKSHANDVIAFLCKVTTRASNLQTTQVVQQSCRLLHTLLTHNSSVVKYFVQPEVLQSLQAFWIATCTEQTAGLLTIFHCDLKSFG